MDNSRDQNSSEIQQNEKKVLKEDRKRSASLTKVAKDDSELLKSKTPPHLLTTRVKSVKNLMLPDLNQIRNNQSPGFKNL